MISWLSKKKDRAPSERRVYFEAGTYIFKENDPGDVMFIIQDGLVDLVESCEGEERHAARLKAGDFFGEVSMLGRLPRLQTARAVTSCNLLRIDESTFEEMLAKNPAIAVRVLRKMAHRLAEVHKDSRKSSPDVAPTAVSDTEKLIHDESGTPFFLSSGTNTTIGRYDARTGSKPDIDLSAIDPERSVNSSHANIVRHGAKLLFYAEVGANDCYVNGQQIKPGLAFELRDSDEIRFGDIKTVLRKH